MTTPVTTAARNAIDMPLITRSTLEVTAFQTGTACEPSPILNELPDTPTRNTLGGGATAASAEPSCRPTYSQTAHRVSSDREPSSSELNRSERSEGDRTARGRPPCVTWRPPAS